MTYTHPAIQCMADRASALEYLMPNGDVVIAYCRVSADEFYAIERERSHQRESQAEPELFT